MKRIFNQISTDTKYDSKKNHYKVTFPDMDSTFVFNYSREGIHIPHKSQAAVAAVLTRRFFPILYKSSKIEAESKVFDWLGIKYKTECCVVEKDEEPTNLNASGVISFF